MTTVQDILTAQARPVPRIAPDSPVVHAAKMMNEFKVGALLICEGDTCRGIFTERDLLRCVANDLQGLTRTPVSSVMSTALLVCSPSTLVDEARQVMLLKQIRNLPVIDGNKQVVGLVSLVDLDAHDADKQELENHYLKQYLYEER